MPCSVKLRKHVHFIDGVCGTECASTATGTAYTSSPGVTYDPRRYEILVECELDIAWYRDAGGLIISDEAAAAWQ